MKERRDTRDTAIAETLGEIRALLDDAVTVEGLEASKISLLKLCARTDLFNFEAFPLPEGGDLEQTYLIHCDTDGRYALYVVAARPGLCYRPHNHGGAWAIVGGVHGVETHRMFVETKDPGAPVEHKVTLDVTRGTAVSMMPDGIHAISADGAEPLLNLHLYAKRFEDQGTRREFDEDTGETFAFRLESLGEIVDLR